MPVAQLSSVGLPPAVGRTTTFTSVDLYNREGCPGVCVVLDMTSVGTGSVTLSIQTNDRASQKYVTLLTGAAIVSNSTNRYVVHPAVTAVANAKAKDVIGEQWRIVVTANNGNPTSWTCGASYLA